MRQEKLRAIMGADLAGVRVLELGAGLGHMGAFLAGLGADVLGLEGRQQNIDLASRAPGYRMVRWDVREDFTGFGPFDVVLNLGLLEVVNAIAPVLRWSCAVSDRIIIDTLVCDAPDERVEVCPASQWLDDALDGSGSRPTPAYVERFHVERGYRVTRHWSPDLNSGPHVYDWEPANDGDCVSGKRRFWEFRRGV